MKRTCMMMVVLCGCLLAFASGPTPTSDLSLKSPAVEIAELEALIAEAKLTGQTPDPAWTTRIRELVPLVKGHPGDVVYDLPAFQLGGGFEPGSVVYPTELTPLEAQIKQLEFEIDGGYGAQEVDPVTYANLKDQLNVLYQQRLENRLRDPLDQGNDACPATVIPSVFYVDSGTTAGRVNNYNPLVACGTSNAPDVIYSFTPPTSTFYILQTIGSSYDTYLYINRAGACPGTQQVACDDDGGPGVSSQIIVRLYSFETYYIVVDGFSTASGAYQLAIMDSCDVFCQGGDVTECAEAIVPTHSQNDCNGACNNQNGIPTWQDISPFQTVCGRMFTYVNHQGQNWRDTDSYRFTLTEPCSVKVTLSSEIPTQLFIFDAACPFGAQYLNQSWVYPCSTVTYQTQCLAAGTYNLWVGPTVFTGITEMKTYRVRVEPQPCSGCRIDAFIQAPGTGAWHTCGAGNNNSLRPSTDYTFAVNIPHAGDWTFSTCNDDSIWDSYIYLTNACNGGIIAQNDDGCGGVGLSVITCASLNAGTYYLTVEGFSSTHCGPFVLNVSECVGSCCYGNPANPVCAYISQTDCDSLSGQWTYMEPCSSGACFVRPTCDNDVLFGQLPYLPDESWGGNLSDLETPFLQYDNYAVSAPIGKVRFWGFMADFDNGNAPCTDDTLLFEVTFIDSTPLNSATYYVACVPTVYPPLYIGLYPLHEFVAVIDPPCTLTDGWVRIAGFSDPSCEFFWSTTISGDGVSGRQQFSGGAPTTAAERAFCLGGACMVDSVTLIWDAPGNATLRWYQNNPGIINFWYTTDPNAVYPVGFLSAGSNSYPAGNNSIGINANFADYVGLVLTLNCNPAQAAMGPEPLRILDLRRNPSE